MYIWKQYCNNTAKLLEKFKTVCKVKERKVKCNINYLVKRTQKIFEYHNPVVRKRAKKENGVKTYSFFLNVSMLRKFFFLIFVELVYMNSISLHSIIYLQKCYRFGQKIINNLRLLSKLSSKNN